MFITLASIKTVLFCCRCSCAFIFMATYSLHRLIMGKVKVGIYFYLTADILTKVFTEVFLEVSSTKYMNFVQTAKFDWLPWQQKGEQILKIHLLESNNRVWGEAETLQKCP